MKEILAFLRELSANNDCISMTKKVMYEGNVGFQNVHDLKYKVNKALLLGYCDEIN